LIKYHIIIIHGRFLVAKIIYFSPINCQKCTKMYE
jgi:hypothetical protein